MSGVKKVFGYSTEEKAESVAEDLPYGSLDFGEVSMLGTRNTIYHQAQEAIANKAVRILPESLESLAERHLQPDESSGSARHPKAIVTGDSILVYDQQTVNYLEMLDQHETVSNQIEVGERYEDGIF